MKDFSLINGLLLLSCLGHLALWRCDWIITCLGGGRFRFSDLQDNTRLAAVMEGTSLRQPLESILLGSFALAAAFPGYLALCQWMRQFSPVCAALMAVGCTAFFVVGATHHVFCGAVEWFYIRMGKTEDARKIILEFFQKTASTMYVCYAGLLIFAVALFVAVVGGWTTLPRWACICNTLPLFLLLALLRTVGTGNLAGAIVTLGLAILI